MANLEMQNDILQEILKLIEVEEDTLEHCVFKREGKERLINQLSDAIKYYIQRIEIFSGRDQLMTTTEVDLNDIRDDIAALQKYLSMKIIEHEAITKLTSNDTSNA